MSSLARLHRTLAIACLLAVGLAGTACGIRWDAEVALVSMRIQEVDVFETTAVFAARIDNAENETLLIDGSAYEIEVDGIRVGRGLLPDRMEIPRLSSLELEIPVYISNIRAATRIRDIVERRRFHYKVRSTLYVVRGGGTRKAKLTHEGNIDLTGGGPGR